jgi:hypothetical protein
MEYSLLCLRSAINVIVMIQFLLSLQIFTLEFHQHLFYVTEAATKLNPSEHRGLNLFEHILFSHSYILSYSFLVWILPVRQVS